MQDICRINWCNNLRIKRLKWDKGNISHVARHWITVKDVEDACLGRHICTNCANFRHSREEKDKDVVRDPLAAAVNNFAGHCRIFQ